MQLEDISNTTKYTPNCEGNYIHSNALDRIYNATPKKKFEFPFSAHTKQIIPPTEDELNQKQKPFKLIKLPQALRECKDQHNQSVSDTSKALSPETAACNNKLDQLNSESLNRNAHQTPVFFKRIPTKTTSNKSNRNDNDILHAVSRNTTNIHQGRCYSRNTDVSNQSVDSAHGLALSTDTNSWRSKDYSSSNTSLLNQDSQPLASIPLIQKKRIATRSAPPTHQQPLHQPGTKVNSPHNRKLQSKISKTSTTVNNTDELEPTSLARWNIIDQPGPAAATLGITDGEIQFNRDHESELLIQNAPKLTVLLPTKSWHPERTSVASVIQHAPQHRTSVTNAKPLRQQNKIEKTQPVNTTNQRHLHYSNTKNRASPSFGIPNPST